MHFKIVFAICFNLDQLFSGNGLTKNIISNLSKLKNFVEGSINVLQMLNFFFRVDSSIVGKGENVGPLHFTSSHCILQRLLPQGC